MTRSGSRIRATRWRVPRSRPSGATLVPVRVDAEGLRVAEGVAQARRARLAVVAPSHQSPLGVALSLPRRLALLSWASANGAFVVEDDYDSEFRYVGRPLPALKSIDRNQRVIYAGSFSKVLFPSLRLGYLVIPEELMETFAQGCRRRHSGVSTLAQRAVTGFMADGHFVRHIRRMRGLYAARREALAEALAAVFGDRVKVRSQAGRHASDRAICGWCPRRRVGKACSGRRPCGRSIVEPRDRASLRAGVAAGVHECRRGGCESDVPAAASAPSAATCGGQSRTP